MRKKALCVGINDYPYEGSDLNGCVNDARAWADLLTRHYDFPQTDVKVLLDSQATKENIMASLQGLLAGAGPGDVLVFTNSSHGTYVPDTEGDEPMYDEALCPYDCADNLIVDDELRELFSGVPDRVRLTVVSDSCHSGTVTRVAIGEIIPGLTTSDDRRTRFLSPALLGKKLLVNPWKAISKSKVKHAEDHMKDILLSGCTDKEYSYDAMIGGKYHGAMTYFALKTIAQANYEITYSQLHSLLQYQLDDAGYPQHPQLEGRRENKKRRIFS